MSSRPTSGRIRALLLAFPDDLNVYGKDLEYLFGPWILVAPVYTEDGRRKVYIPSGPWFNFWDGTSVTGPENVSIQAPLDRMPRYVRGGAIVPMMPPAARIPSGPVDPLILNVYPSGESSYLVVEDDGTTGIRCAAADSVTTLEWSGGPVRRLTVCFNGVPRVTSLRFTLDRVTLKRDAIRQMRDDHSVPYEIPYGESGTIRIGR